MISKVIRSKSSTNLLRYILKDHAHNTELTKYRNLNLIYNNIDFAYNRKPDYLYTISQFSAVQSLAKNKQKKTKAYHIIFSFSQDEFPIPKSQKELVEQTKQASKLVNGFLKKDLPNDSQYVLAIQRDSKGKMLHAHIALNSVKLDGKVVNTKALTWSDREREVKSKDPNKDTEKVLVKGLKTRIDDYMQANFERVTGRKYAPIRQKTENLVNSKEEQIKARINDKNGQFTTWKEELKGKIYKAFSVSDSLETFKKALKNEGVNVTERRVKNRQSGTGYTYSFVDSTNKKRRIRDFGYRKGVPAGLGTSFTPESLEKELENGNNFTRKQLQENATNDIRNFTAKLDTVDKRFGPKDAGKREQNSDEINERRSEKGSNEPSNFDDNVRAIEHFTNIINNSNKSTKTINRPVNDDRRKREAIKQFKPDLSALTIVNKQFFESLRKQREEYEKDQRRARESKLITRSSNSDDYDRIDGTRPENSENGRENNDKHVERTTGGQVRRQRDDQEDELNPFSDF